MTGAKITVHYRISGPVDFLDVHVDRDNRLFIDPSRIRVAQKTDPLAGKAYGLLTSFFDEVLRCINSTNPADRRKGEAILQAFGEPHETRLGMSSVGVRGHGGSEGIGSSIWHELLNNQLCRVDVAVLKYIEDMPIFVSGVDADITSDVTTRIILPALAAFTNQMMAKHPEFSASPHVTTTTAFPVWNSTTLRWESQRITLPGAAGKPLLLVPKAWAGPRLLMTYGQYYQLPLLGRIQDERAAYDPARKRIVKPYKKTLSRQPNLLRSRQTCTTQTVRAFQDGVDLVDRYRHQADERAVPLTDEQLARYLAR
jgi:hypothetical protein